MPTKHKPQSPITIHRIVGIALLVLAAIGFVGWKVSTSTDTDKWQFYVSVHYGNPSQGDPETKTTVIDGLKSSGRWTDFRLTSICDFHGPTADIQQYMTVMSEQPEVRQMEHPESNTIFIRLSQPLNGAALTDFSNFMLEGLVHTGLNNCGNSA